MLGETLSNANGAWLLEERSCLQSCLELPESVFQSEEGSPPLSLSGLLLR